MEDFLDQELPSFLYTFVTGGPTFYTEIQYSNGGGEVRFANRIAPINRYKVSNCKLTTKQMSELQKFFCTVQGRKYAFRFRDPIDYRCQAEGLGLIGEESLGLLDKEKLKFQLIKVYLSEEQELEDKVQGSYRKILKPAKNTVEIYLNETDKNIRIEIETKDLKDLYDQGIVTIKNINNLITPRNVNLLTANFSFDIPVRFETDALRYRSELDSCVSIESFELVEVLQ